MAVYKHRYGAYSGELTATWQRFLVIPRYAYRRVFHSRFFTAFFVLCFVAPLGASVLIYLRHNLSALQMLQIPEEAFLPINANFFRILLVIQGVQAFLLTSLIGPGLVSPDLTHNALPLYLSRPFSKTEYVIGKLSVLLFLQSAMTWVPLSLLFFLQATLAGEGWLTKNAWILGAILLGSLIWILFLSLLALAISAWVRWKSVAGALIFGVFFVGAGFGAAIKEIFVTPWGDLFNLNKLIWVIWEWLFLGPDRATTERIGRDVVDVLPVWSAWATMIVISGICLLLLARRIRAYEVIRG